MKLVLRRARAYDARMPRRLAAEINCRRCGRPVFVVVCRDSRWRLFERALLPAGTPGVWAWRKRLGMEETDLVAGYGLHYCPKYHERPDPDDYTLPGWLGTSEGIDVEAAIAEHKNRGTLDTSDPGWTWVCAACGGIAVGWPAFRRGNKWFCGCTPME